MADVSIRWLLSLGQALKALYTCWVIDSTMLLLCSHFTEEEIKAQRSLMQFTWDKTQLGGSSEGVSRWKADLKGEQPGLSIDMGRTCEEGRGRVWVWNDVWWGSWRGRQRADPDESLFTSLFCILERHWRGLSKTHDQTWRSKSWRDGKKEMRHRWAGLASACLQRASCKNAFQLLWFVLFSSKLSRHDF